MAYEMKRYQQRAYEQYRRILEFIDYRQVIRDFHANPTDPQLALDASGKGEHNFRIQIDAPTGAGKTVLMGHVSKGLHRDYVQFVFSPGAGNLHEQTARRLASIVGPMHVTVVDDTSFAQELVPGMVYVCNWEKLVSRDKTTGDYKNRIVREGDQRNFFDALIEAGNRGLPVLVTIDEAHHGKGSTVSSIRAFLADITKMLGYSPLFVEVSATPVLDGNPHPVKIPLAAVQAEELIRKSVRLNGAGLLAKVDALTADQRASQQIEPFLIDYAIDLQTRLDAAYIEADAHEIIDGEKVYYHSLIGLQIPNGPLGRDALARAEAYLRDAHGITRANDQLLVYLSDDDDKTFKRALLDDLASPASPVRVLIYKQGIATGWDCPRAQILLGFRHITSKIFTKQNLGRYVRTTQQRYYGNDLLDHTYVISNVGDLGQASFGDDVDTSLNYEKEAVLRVAPDGHIALSSFNPLKLPQSHYSHTETKPVPAHIVKAKWEAAASAAKLWTKLGYSNIAELSDNHLVSAEMSIEALEDGSGFTEQGSSRALAADNDRQYRDFEGRLLELITAGGRDYGANARLARFSARVLVRWYREAVWAEADKKRPHAGQRRDVQAALDAERKAGRLHGKIDENDLAVEQLTLDPAHWAAVSEVYTAMLAVLPGAPVQTEDGYRASGADKTTRTLVDDGVYEVAVTKPVWISATTDTLVGKDGVGLPALYARHLVNEPTIAHRQGLAELSGPEAAFEKDFLPSITSTSADRLRLAYYEKSPENATGSFRLGVTSLDGTLVTDFYPDYVGELYDPRTGAYEPFVLEVKSEEEACVSRNFKDRHPLMTGKMRALADLASEHGVKAGVVYLDTQFGAAPEWRIVTEVHPDGATSHASLRDYLLEG